MLPGDVNIVRILRGIGGTTVGTLVLKAGDVHRLHVVEGVALVGVALAADGAGEEDGAPLHLPGDEGVKRLPRLACNRTKQSSA